MVDERRYRPLVWAVSLPFVVAAVWVALVLLAQHHRNSLVEQLSDVAVHGNTKEAAAAVRQLSAMPRPPVELLAAAATSPTRDVALEAQSAISDVVRRWYRQAKTGRNQQRVAAQLTELVEALASQQPVFSIADYPWLGRITRRILRLANQFPPEMSLPIAPQCEAILANIESADASFAAFTAVSPALPSDERIAAALVASTPAAVSDDRIPRRFAPHTGTLDALGDEAVAVVAQPAGENGRSKVAFVLPHSAANGQADPPAVSSENRPPSADDRTSSDGNQPPISESPLSVLDSPTAPDNQSFGWRLRGSRQTVASPPASESPVAVVDGGPSTATGVPTSVAVTPTEPASADHDSDAALASLETRSLLARWLAADAISALESERELARRGFGRLSADLVEQLLSPDIQSRCDLVTDLLVQPGVDARPWLVLLANDSVAEVRLAAVSMMATSNDPQLIEEAWQVVLHDRDPRIASLAPRLRARQASGQQR